jgi:hypothetical protein
MSGRDPYRLLPFLRFVRQSGGANASATSVATTQTQLSLPYAMTPMVIGEAARLLDRHVLRALGAIQLATATIARGGSSSLRQVMFVASDVRLLSAANAEGLTTWYPTSGIAAA